MSSRINRFDNGFSLVELLIALAISAVLLVALAVAFQASVTNYQENEDIFNAVNTARATLIRITNHLRTASAISVTDPAEQCSFYDSNGSHITYRYDSGDGKLYLVTNDDLTDDDYVLCDNVTAMSFSKQIDTDDESGEDFVKSVQISITVVRGQNSKTISAAVCVRNNL